MADDGSLDDHRLAAAIASSTGHLLLEVRARLDGAPLDELRRAGDRRAHEHILAELDRHRPDDAVLSEEGADDDARLSAPRTWIVDPLDGTREYAEGRSDWAVHVALVEGGELAAGAVALPGLGAILSTASPPVVPPPSGGPVRLLVSRTRPPEVALAIGDALGAELVPMGSAGAKAMAVVRGEGDVYAHAGGQYQWDSAAPVAVAVAAGLHASRMDGSPLRYNLAETWLPDVVVCRPELAARVLEAAARA